MHFIDVIILGIVEGVTEFLPISSTGHMILASRILGLTQSDFLKSFEIIIQLGAILAVVALYFRKFFDIEVLKRIIVGFIPTAIIGLIFYKLVKNFLGSESVVLWSLFLGGVVIILFEILKKNETGKEENGITKLTYKDCTKIGLFQSIAIIPGVSRSAATIIGGLSIGIDRKTITEYSFLIAVPTMVAATGLELIKGGANITPDQFGLLFVGFLVSFVVAFVAIKSFIKFVQHHKFTGFGIYRIVVAGVFFFVGK
ncbi:MAG: undecaprenyl-diphosphatase UppP [Candidatus Paceibacterota bacterium]